MERGVNTTISKQRGRFFEMKRRPFHCKETPSSVERRRFFHFKILLPLYLSGIGVHVNGSIHAPLHSERGKGVRLVVDGDEAFPLYYFTLAINSSGVTSVCSPVVIFFKVTFPSFISDSPARATKPMFFAFA